MFNADAARNMANRVKNTGLIDAMTMVEHAITEYAKKGKTHITISAERLNKVVDAECLVKELRKRGFKAEYVSDQRDGNFYSINWR